MNEPNEHNKQIDFCKKYQELLQTIFEDDELREWCCDYSVYSIETGHEDLHDQIRLFTKAAYDSEIVVSDYQKIIAEGKMEERFVANPTEEFLEGLSIQQLIACIAWHFRRDHFVEGSLISDSIGRGVLLKYFCSVLKWEAKNTSIFWCRTFLDARNGNKYVFDKKNNVKYTDNNDIVPLLYIPVDRIDLSGDIHGM